MDKIVLVDQGISIRPMRKDEMFTLDLFWSIPQPARRAHHAASIISYTATCLWFIPMDEATGGIKSVVSYLILYYYILRAG